MWGLSVGTGADRSVSWRPSSLKTASQETELAQTQSPGARVAQYGALSVPWTPRFGNTVASHTDTGKLCVHRTVFGTGRRPPHPATRRPPTRPGPRPAPPGYQLRPPVYLPARGSSSRALTTISAAALRSFGLTCSSLSSQV